MKFGPRHLCELVHCLGASFHIMHFLFAIGEGFFEQIVLSSEPCDVFFSAPLFPFHPHDVFPHLLELLCIIISVLNRSMRQTTILVRLQARGGPDVMAPRGRAGRLHRRVSGRHGSGCDHVDDRHDDHGHD